MPLVEATSRLKQVGSSVRCVYKEVERARKQIGIAEAQLHDKIRAIDNLMTNTPIAPRKIDGVAPIEVKKGIVEYSAPRTAEIMGEIEALKNSLFEIQMNICTSYPLS